MRRDQNVVGRTVSRSRWAWLAAVTVVAMVPTLADLGTTAAPAQALPASCGWSIRKGAPNPQYAGLKDIDGAGAGNIWAVGSKGALGAPLIMRYNGRRWSTVPTPDPSNFVGLEGIDVKSHRNAWAVGWYSNGSRLQTLILHWNGLRWTRTPSPNPLTGDNLLFDVVTAGPDKAWAVGTDNLNADAGRRTIILRWNGTRWVNDRPTRARGYLSGVALRSGKVFAVGGNVNLDPMVQRRKANGWVSAKIPTEGPTRRLFSIDVAPRGPFRGVGTKAGNPNGRTFAMHSKPSGWVNDATPSRGSYVNQLFDVSARSRTEAWAVGYRETSTFRDRTLTLRFHNGSWSLIPSPNPNGRDVGLSGVYAVPNKRGVWAVGTKHDSINAARPLVMHFHC